MNMDVLTAGESIVPRLRVKSLHQELVHHFRTERQVQAVQDQANADPGNVGVLCLQQLPKADKCENRT